MAGVSGSSTVNGLYSNANVISGLVSGLDTESMIEGLVDSYNQKIITYQQDIVKLQWEQAAYRDVITDLVNFTSKYTSFTSDTNLISNAFFNSATTSVPSGEFSDSITVSGTSDSTIDIQSVLQTATQSRLETTALSDAIDSDYISGTTADMSETQTVGALDGYMTFTYGSSTTISIDWDESTKFGSDNQAGQGNEFAEYVNEKLSGVNVSVGGTTYAASEVMEAYYNEETGNVEFRDLLEAGNSITLTNASTTNKDLLGIEAGCTEIYFGTEVDRPVEGSDTGAIKDLNKQTTGYSKISGEDITISFNGSTKTLTMPEIEEILDDDTKEVIGYKMNGDTYMLDGTTSTGSTSTDPDDVRTALNNAIAADMQSSIDKLYGNSSATITVANVSGFDRNEFTSNTASDYFDANGSTLSQDTQNVMKHIGFDPEDEDDVQTFLNAIQADPSYLDEIDDIYNSGDLCLSFTIDGVANNTLNISAGTLGQYMGLEADNYNYMNSSLTLGSILGDDIFPTVEAVPIYEQEADDDGRLVFTDEYGAKVYAEEVEDDDGNVTTEYTYGDGSDYTGKVDDLSEVYVQATGEDDALLFDDDNNPIYVIDSYGQPTPGEGESYLTANGSVTLSSSGTYYYDGDGDKVDKVEIENENGTTEEIWVKVDDDDMHRIGTALVVNDVEVGVFDADSSLQDVLDAINTSDAGVTASFSTLTNKIVMTSNDTGASQQINISSENSDGSENLFAAALFGENALDGGDADTFTSGTNALMVVDVNGEQVLLERESNTFDIDGLKVTVKETFGNTYGEDGEETAVDFSTFIANEGTMQTSSITFTEEIDPSPLVEAITQMVDDYNALMSKIKTYFTETPLTTSSGGYYKPLTDADSSTMTESAIETYETNAKTGILFGDTNMRSLYSTLGSVFSAGGAFGMDLYSMGFDVGYGTAQTLSENTVNLDVDKLTEYLSTKTGVEKARLAFTSSTDSGDSADGIMATLKSKMDTYGAVTGSTKGILVEAAGSELSSLSLLSNSMQTKIDNFNELITAWEEKLSNKVDYYTSQFAQLEILMSEMNSQSSALSGLSGY